VKAALVTLAIGVALLGVAAAEARLGGSALRVTQEDRDGAVEAVRQVVTLSSHLVRSSADQRFVDRIPAATEVVEEMVADVAFTRHEGRMEEPQPVRIQVEAVEPSRPAGVEVVTREYWVVRVTRVPEGTPEPQVRADVVQARYFVRREGARWRVVSWRIEPPPAPVRQEPRSR